MMMMMKELEGIFDLTRTGVRIPEKSGKRKKELQQVKDREWS